MDHTPPFSIGMSLAPDRARIFLRGELDLHTIDILRTCFDETFTTNGNHRSLIRLDLTDLTFCDAVGLHALQDLADRCYRLGATLQLVNLPDNTRRVMELTETIGQFNIESDLRRPRSHDTGRI